MRFLQIVKISVFSADIGKPWGGIKTATGNPLENIGGRKLSTMRMDVTAKPLKKLPECPLSNCIHESRQFTVRALE